MKLLLLSLLALAYNAFADEIGPDFDPDDGEAYELAYGYYPYRTYQSFDLISPQIRKLVDSPACDDGLYTFLTPRGFSIWDPGNAILDNNGDLIWAKSTGGQAYDLRVQNFNGKQYLSYWAGDDRVRGHGMGDYFMVGTYLYELSPITYAEGCLQLNTSYQEEFKISALNNLTADLHEMVVTPAGTALLTIYEVYPKDMTSMRTFTDEDVDPNYIWDCLFQEIDIASNTLLFQWRASDHYALNETFHDVGPTGTKEDPFDFFHINSVQKDELGNYIISSRYTHTVTYICGSTGNTIWTLGGKRNQFADQSDGEATNFAWQHDARLHSLNAFPELLHEEIVRKNIESKHGRQNTNTTLITIFDNGCEDIEVNRETSRGLLLQVTYPADPSSASETDSSARQYTARVVRSFEHPQHVLSTSQGSVQVLPSVDQHTDAKVLVGYGFNAIYTEFDSSGSVLCDVHFATNYSWQRGDVQSYRTFKFPWVGQPAEPPSAVLAADGDAIYVSWNGATEVKTWVLQNSISASVKSGWTDIMAVQKHGFENELEFEEEVVHRYMRVRALGADGRTLGISNVVDLGWSTVSCRYLHVVSRHSNHILQSFADSLPDLGGSRAWPMRVLTLLAFNLFAIWALHKLYRRALRWRTKRDDDDDEDYMYSPIFSEA